MDIDNNALYQYLISHPHEKDRIRAFIAANKDADLKALALKALPHPDWPRAALMDQIKARQMAQKKLPDWAAQDDIIFPAADIVEQASSRATSYYKAQLVSGDKFADLTAGSGADTAALAKNFKQGWAVDMNAQNAALLAHNLPLLTDTPIDVQHGKAEDVLADLPALDLIYIDPQRRTDEGKRGLILLESCMPDVTALLSTLIGKAKKILIKTSPALDISRCVKELKYVTDIHILEWQGQCREVLYLLDKSEAVATESRNPQIHVVTLDDDGQRLTHMSFALDAEQSAEAQTEYGAPQTYLYEPSPAFMKSGGFHVIADKYNCAKLHKHTHLYTSGAPLPDFPGRIFEITDILPADKKALKAALPHKKANLAIRNFPAAIDKLKKQLGIKDGGNSYIFACTLADDSLKLILCRKYQP